MTAAPEPELSPVLHTRELRSIRDRLHEDFSDLGTTAIDHWIEFEALQFEGSRITAFVPILVEKNTRSRLRSLRRSG